MEKSVIRERMRGLRRALTEREIQEKSAVIQSALFSLDAFKCASVVLVYVSAFREVDTAAVIERIKAEGKRAAVPVSDIATHTITPSYIEGKMKKGAYGIWEPEKIVAAAAADIDLVIVPGIAFDTRCNRCGFGAGYYDRFLAESRAYKAALCYDFQIVDELETDEHDIPMDAVISERRVIYAV